MLQDGDGRVLSWPRVQRGGDRVNLRGKVRCQSTDGETGQRAGRCPVLGDPGIGQQSSGGSSGLTIGIASYGHRLDRSQELGGSATVGAS